jgi:hypothetical protein
VNPSTIGSVKAHGKIAQRSTRVRLEIPSAADPSIVTRWSTLVARKWQIHTVVLLAASVSLLALTPQGFAQNSEWLTPSAPVVSWTDAINHVSQRVTVQGTIAETYYYFYRYYFDGAYFLVFHYPNEGYFYGVILSSDSSNFKCSIAEFYLNKHVRITGTIQLYDGVPEITVAAPSQIEVAYQGFSCS